jgi:hypothetical protein
MILYIEGEMALKTDNKIKPVDKLKEVFIY